MNLPRPEPTPRPGASVSPQCRVPGFLPCEAIGRPPKREECRPLHRPQRCLPPGLLLLCALTLALLLPPPPEAFAQGQMRTLSRDTSEAGPSGVRLETLEPIFSDSSLREALQAFDGGRSRAAEQRFAAWLADNESHRHAGHARFVVGWALYTQDRHADALPWLEACVADDSLFRDYCAWGAADSALHLEDAEKALTWSHLVDPGAVYGPRARYLRGRALHALGRSPEAVEVYLDFLGDHPTAFYRNALEFDLAEALLAADEVNEAALVYHRIATRNPDSSDETRSNAAIRSLRDRLDAATRERVTRSSHADTIRRAEVLYNRHRSDQVVAMLMPIHRELGTRNETGCQAAHFIANSYRKLRQHGNSAPFFDEIVENCEDPDMRVRALFNGARAWWNQGDYPRGYARFEQLWTEYPDHSFADDAMLFAARIRRSQNRPDDASTILQRQIAAYPDGDMLKDAVWLLLARYYIAGEYRAAARFAEGVHGRTGEDDLYSRGRIAYFHGRSLENLGLQREARAIYERVVREHPMGYYSLLAINRLRGLDEDAATALIAELREDSAQTEGFIFLPPHISSDRSFRLAREFVRMELYELASGEFSALQRRHPNDDDLGWVVSLIFHRAGSFDRSHNVPGNRVGLNLSYPAASNRERWVVAYPQPYRDSVYAWARERRLDPNLVYAIMREESGFRAGVESWANALGLLQLMLPTANDMARRSGRGSVTRQQLLDPDTNIELGTMYMRHLADRWGEHPGLVIAGYNGGVGNVGRWLGERGHMPFDLWVEEIPFGQTRNYVKRVTMSYWVYRWLYDDGLPWLPMDESLADLNQP